MANKPAEKEKPKGPLAQLAEKTDERFTRIEGTLENIEALLLQQTEAKSNTPVVETKLDKEITKAGPDKYLPIPPGWEEKAKEIIGEPLEKCSMSYLENGGVIIEVYIKKEFSNAPKDYLDFYKVDKRSKSIGNEGLGGAEQFFKLIAQNLARKTTIR
jgi:hypothetical protein